MLFVPKEYWTLDIKFVSQIYSTYNFFPVNMNPWTQFINYIHSSINHLTLWPSYIQTNLAIYTLDQTNKQNRLLKQNLNTETALKLVNWWCQ